MKHRDSEARDKIIPFVNDFYRDNHRSPSLRQISAFTGIPRMTVQRMLNTFADEGIIDYDGETIVTEVTNKVESETTPAGVHGDLVLIKKTDESYPGLIVVAYVEGEGNTLKTYKEKNGKAYLHPENKKYADIPLHDCKIQGIAVSVTRKLDTKGRTGK